MLKNHISFDKCARWIALAFRFLWFMAFLLIPAPRVVRPQELRQPMKPMNSVPASRQTIYAPLAALDDPSAAEIVVLNNGVSLTPVEATLYGADGRILNTSRLNLPPGEPRYIPISNLVPGLNQPQAHLGGINLSYVGQSMQVVAQITIQGNAKRGSFEVEFFVDMDFSSTVLDAVWWKPTGGTSTLIVGNSSGEKVGAKIRSSVGAERHEEIDAHSTKFIKWNDDAHREREKEEVESARIEFTGMPGALRPMGFVTGPDGYTSSIRFYDPAAAVQQNLYATDLPVADADVHLVVANSDDSPVVITPTFYLIGVENASPVRLHDLAIPAHKTTQVNIFDVILAAKRAGAKATTVELLNNGRPGALIGALTSTSRTTNLTYDVPLRDSGKIGKSTGNYPIRWDSDHSSVITISNVSFEPVKFASYLELEGDKRYTFPVRTLVAGETAVFDMDELKRAGQHDAWGNTFPPETKFGKFHWTIGGTPGSARLIGRNQVVSTTKRVSSSFSCNCNCPDAFTGPLIDGWPPTSVPLGWQGSSNTYDQWQPCSGTSYITPDYGSLWNSNPNVLSDDESQKGTSRFTALAPGFTDLSIYWSIFTYVDNPDTYTCDESATYGDAGSSVAVKPTISGPNTVWYFSNLTVSGYTTSAQLTANGGNSSTTWNITAGADKITVSSFTGSSINVLSSATAFSSSVGDVKLTATASGQTSAPFSLTTRTPNQLVPGTPQTNCDATYGYVTTIPYVIQDQLQASLPSDVPLNENWTTSVTIDYSGTTWQRPDPGFATSDGPNFGDFISGRALSTSPVPVPTCDGDSTSIHYWGQEWRIGSIATGFGRRVQTDTLHRYKAYAAHLGITSPAP